MFWNSFQIKASSEKFLVIYLENRIFIESLQLGNGSLSRFSEFWQSRVFIIERLWVGNCIALIWLSTNFNIFDLSLVLHPNEDDLMVQNWKCGTSSDVS